MEKGIKTLKLKIKGNMKKFWNALFLKDKMRQLGVELHAVKHSNNDIELLVSGETHRLWGVVEWSKGRDMYMMLNEVIFEFADFVPTR